jgi:hypothetical protein
MREARARCKIIPDRVLIVTDPFQYYAPEIRKTWGPTCLHAQHGFHRASEPLHPPHTRMPALSNEHRGEGAQGTRASDHAAPVLLQSRSAAWGVEVWPSLPHTRTASRARDSQAELARHLHCVPSDGASSMDETGGEA